MVETEFPRQIPKRPEFRETEHVEGVAQQRPAFEGIGDQGMGESPADPGGLRRIEVSVDAEGHRRPRSRKWRGTPASRAPWSVRAGEGNDTAPTVVVAARARDRPDRTARSIA